jgi:hypothetical protein
MEAGTYLSEIVKQWITCSAKSPLLGKIIINSLSPISSLTRRRYLRNAFVLKAFRQSKLIQFTLLTSLLVSLFFVYFSEQVHYEQSRLTTKNIASSYVSLIKNSISQALSATYPLAALIRNQKVILRALMV